MTVAGVFVAMWPIVGDFDARQAFQVVDDELAGMLTDQGLAAGGLPELDVRVASERDRKIWPGCRQVVVARLPVQAGVPVGGIR